MAMSAGDIDTAARRLASAIFVEASQTAHTDLDGLKAMVQAIDDVMEVTPPNVANQSATIQANLNQAALAAAPNTTLAQRAIALQVWAAKKANLF